MPRPLLPCAGAVVLVLLLSATAHAAPARTLTLDGPTAERFTTSGTGVASFSDGRMPSPQCTVALRECDDTLLDVRGAGTLTVSTRSAGTTEVDVALDLFTADATGRPRRLVTSADRDRARETVTAQLATGFHLVRVDVVGGFGQLEAEVTFTPAAPGAEPPRRSNAAPVAVLKLPTTAKATTIRGIAGTAGDDRRVERVQVAVLRRRGDACSAMRARGTFSRRRESCRAPRAYLAASGTRSWVLRLRRPLPPGRYVVFARAIDDAGVVQRPPSRRALRIT